MDAAVHYTRQAEMAALTPQAGAEIFFMPVGDNATVPVEYEWAESMTPGRHDQVIIINVYVNGSWVYAGDLIGPHTLDCWAEYIESERRRQ